LAAGEKTNSSAVFLSFSGNQASYRSRDAWQEVVAGTTIIASMAATIQALTGSFAEHAGAHEGEPPEGVKFGEFYSCQICCKSGSGV
jgi:hypothetical protein